MANPKKRRTASAARRNRSHLALSKKTLNACPKCDTALKPHHACTFCGSYKGREVVKTKGAVKAAKAIKANKKK